MILELVLGYGALATTSFFVFNFGWIVDEMRQIPWVARGVVSRTFKAAQLAPLNPPPEMVTPHVQMERCFKIAMSTRGGVHIMGGPRKMGKSTIASGGIYRFRRMYPNRSVLFERSSSTILKNRNLHTRLGVPTMDRISRYVPKDSVVVIDQVDCFLTDFTDEMADYVKEIATDSSQNPTFNVIIIVSDAKLFRALLNLDPCGEIFRDVCDPVHLKWTPEMIVSVVGNTFGGWNRDQKRNLRTELMKSGSPWIVQRLLQKQEISLTPVPKRQVIEAVRAYSARVLEEWAEYEAASATCNFRASKLLFKCKNMSVEV